MKKVYVFILLLSVLVIGGTILQNKSDAPAAVVQPEPSIQPSPEASASPQSGEKSASQRIWDMYAANYGVPSANGMITPNSAPEEPDMLPLYLEGLKHENAYVRWACASRLFEFGFREDSAKICDALKPLLQDESELVRKAAAFSIEVLDGTYDGPEFVKSTDGKFVVFHGFNDSRYNDGKVWMDNRDLGGLYQIDAAGSLGGISISPGNSKLCFSTYGRYWSDVSVYDIKTGKTSFCGLFKYLSDNKDKYGFKIGRNQRSDPYVSLVEWSPDSKKLLLFCSFTDDEYMNHKVSAIYDIASGGFEKVRVLPGKSQEDYNPTPEKPKSFKW